MKLLSPIISVIILLIVTPAYAFAATLSLSPSGGTFNKGCPVTLEIKLDTGGLPTDGTDAIVSYDQSRLTATSITNGTIYADYPGNNIDGTSGKITTSGLASVSSVFTGIGTLATLNFIVKETAATGVTQISFEFDPNNKTKTTDSNVLHRGGTIADILSSVVNGSYTIGTGSCVAAPPAPAQGTPPIYTLPRTGGATPAGQPKSLDQLVDQTGKGPGTPELTSAIAIVGSVLTILGILGLALL